VGKLIKFPSRKTIQNKDIVENLHIEIEHCEGLLKEALEHLEYLNEEIVMLTEEHTQLLNDLIKLTDKEEQ
jgi:archaellum component FlaC|tara:strand:+ start:92 stop:304 length:213 start_codon:yes stop_codon:yes gene_type:complete